MHADPALPPDGYVLLNGGAANGDAWPEIDASLIEETRGEVPAFPLEVLPPAWRDWVAETAQSAGTPVDYVALGLFAAVAAVCGAGVQIRVTQSWSEALVLWLALVGSPSSGKSPALGAVRRQLMQIEDDVRASDVERRARHAASREQARFLTDKWEDECEVALEAGRGAPEKPAAASFDEEFVPSQIVVADATVEALADVVSGNPRGVVLWRDELAAWLANLERYARGGSDRAHWLEAWAAAAVTINRKSRAQPLHLPKFALSVVGTIQPDRIAEAFQGSDDGMAARFLYGWPDAPPYTSLLDRQSPRDEEALAMLQKIAHSAGTAEQPLTLCFETEAVIAFDHFMRELHQRATQCDGFEAGWMGKGPGTVARLAAALTLLAWTEDHDDGVQAPLGPITPAATRNAIFLWLNYFHPHALSVFHQAGRTDRDREARRVVRWLKATGKTEISREQIRVDALLYSADAEGANRVIERLEQAGILRPAAVVKARHRPARRWTVNPALR